MTCLDKQSSIRVLTAMRSWGYCIVIVGNEAEKHHHTFTGETYAEGTTQGQYVIHPEP